VELFQQHFDEALRLAEEALKVNPKEHFALFTKAKALAHKGAPDALAAFKAAVAARKTAPVFYFEGARLLQNNGQFDGALALLADYEAHDSKVMVTTTDGKATPALERDDRYWIVRGDVLRAADKPEQAMAAYDKAIAANSVGLARAHYAKGALLLATREYDKALEELKLVTPNDGSGSLPDAYLAMGETLFAKKEFVDGCQHFAFGMMRLKAQQAPRERLNGILDDVSKKLVANSQKAMAKAWDEEARRIIQ
jgi:tetratricopeptide (TPR) repeat protein